MILIRTVTFNYNFSAPFRYLSSGLSRTAGRCRHEKTFLLVAVFAVSLMVIGVGDAEVQHTVKPEQIVASDPAPYHLTGNTWSILDLSASQSGYAFAQILDNTSLTDGAFVTTWRTTTADESITLPISGSGMTVDWGDGNTTAGVSTPVDHTYNTAGDYTVQITGGLTWFHLNNAADASKLVSLDQWGNTTWTTMKNAFYGADNMAYNAADSPDLSTVTDMSGMFHRATSFDGDLSSWDVSSVTDMNEMFQRASDFNQPLNAWDVSSVTDMTSMFYRASSFNQTLNSWDVSSVTTMFRMFLGASSFNQLLNSWNVSDVTDMTDMFQSASSFNQPLNNWDVSKVTSMTSMFYRATSFNQTLNSWDVSSVTIMFRMFFGATSFNQPLNAWDVSSVTTMFRMFTDADSFNQPLNDWDVSSVTSMADMFSFATAFDQDLANWYVVQDPPVLTANATFSIRAQNSYLDGLVSTYSIDDTRFVMDDKTLSLNSTNLPPAGMYPLDITAPAVLGEPNAGEKGHTRTLSVTVKEHRPFITTWTASVSDYGITLPMVGTYSVLWGDGSNSTNVSGSQSHTYGVAGDYAVTVLGDGLEYIRLHGDNVNALQLKSIDQWGDTRWTTMHEAFFGAHNMVYNATDSPDLGLVSDMSSMFDSAYDFNGNLSSWDVSSVTNMNEMFAVATSFNQPLNDWDVSSVTEMDGMFYFAYDFNQPLNSWDVSSVTDMNEMFYYAISFNQPLNAWNVSKVTDMSSMFYEATDFNQPLNSWNVSRVTNMDDMFYLATAFSQNLGEWYVTLDLDTIAGTGIPGVVGTISAQNQPLKNHSPTYVIVDGLDKNHFEIVPGNQLNMISGVSEKAEYSVNVTASGESVFESGNNWRLLVVSVSAALSDNADLTGLTISSGTLSPQFSSSDITYTASVDNSVTQVTVTPTASDSSAAITVNGNTVTSGNGYIVIGLIAGEPNTVTVIVTAQDSTTKTYIITLTRAASLSDNADLTGLTISSGTLSPQFSSSDITYTASVDNSVTQVTVTPTASDSSAAITVNDNTVTSGNGYIVIGLIAGEPNTVTVIVTAQDSTTKTYIITLTRAASLSDNADLTGLTISSGTLSPQFSSSDITYTASVDNSVTQVTVTPTASDSSATITVNDNTVTSGNGYILTGLIAGEPNTVTVIVTAQDSTTKTYTITLTRAASLSDNADLTGLTISSGTLSPQFSSSDITYTASVDNSVTQVTVTPTASDSSAAITVNGNTVTSGNGYILTGLTAGEPNTVTVIVTAQDSTTKTYTITLTRAASLSDNADLTGLTISSGTLSPQFSSSDITYTASVDNSVTQVTVTPTASDSSATITVNDNTVTSGTGYILTGLTVGEPTTVTVIVTAQDSTTKTYTITLTRAASLSDNADLTGLTISSGTLSPQFSSSDITYTASVDNSVTQVTVTPTASDSSAAITVNDNTVTSGTGYILTGLTVGEPTTVTVIVTAQDSTTKTYTITVTVRDVPITVSSAAYNPGNGQLTITFNQDIATVDYSGLHVRSSANPDTGGITLSSVTGADYSGRTITATLDSEQQDQYDALQSPHLVVEDGAVTDTDGDRTTDVPPQPIRDASQKGSSSSPSSKASIVHINALAQSRLVDIPPHIAEQVESHDASDPLEPITPDDTFDLPLVINGYGYLLDAYENTLIPQTVTAGDNPVHITFTVYTEKEFAHFILYLNLQGRNTNYADSDTYITYKDDGTTSVTDPHGYIGSATVTVTQEDDQIPEKRTVRITIEFGEEPMGPTNMVAYMWNTDREALFVKIIDALEVVAASPESAMQAADPEPVTPDFADDAADPEPVPYDILGPDDYDDTQILQIIRMWSGFESESITDEQLLELLGLDDHQGADIPDWMMTELGVLVAKGTVTVDEFLVALQYVLEHD